MDACAPFPPSTPRTASGQLLDAAQRAPVTVTKKARPAAVVMSIEDYAHMRGAAWKRLFETMATARKQATGAA